MYNFKTQPFKHQLDCWEISKNKQEYALFIDMGGGKSKIVIDTVGHLFLKGEITQWICIAPKGVYKTWITEIEKHMSEDIPYAIYTWNGSCIINKTNRKPLQIILINTEAFSTKKGVEFINKTITSECLLSIDESTTIKNPKSKRTKAIDKLGGKVKYRRIMSGYPSPQSQLDLYSQFAFLNQNIFGIKSYFAFRNEFCKLQEINLGPGRSFVKIIGSKNIDKLKEKIQDFSFRIRKDECLDLPPKIFQFREVEMNDLQEKAYKDIKNNAFTILSNEETVTTNMIMVQLTRLHQIVCGYTKTDNGEIISFDETNYRLETMLDLLDEMDQVIVWANYVQNIKEIENAIQKKYGNDSVVSYYGETKQNERDRAIEGFQNKSIRFFVGNPSTAGFGLTLTAASSVIYYSNSYNLEHRLQSEDRVHRIGQTRSVNYVDLITPKTVDEKIIKTLISKKNIADSILGDEWKSWIL